MPKMKSTGARKRFRATGLEGSSAPRPEEPHLTVEDRSGSARCASRPWSTNEREVDPPPAAYL